MIADLVRPEIKAMTEVDWGEVPDDTPYRLLWGENQQVLSGYEEVIVDQIKKLNLYPSATKRELREKIALYNKVKPENIVATNGSDEALELIAKVFLSPKDEVVIPSPSYPCFDSASQMMGAKIKKVSLEPDFSLDLAKLIEAINTGTKIVWLANPNNPTGNILLSPAQIETLARKTKCLIVCDECYFELAGVTAAPLVERFPHIIVTRSFSKVFALAGVRLGYIIANPEAVAYLNRLQQTNQVFSVNRFAQTAGIAILSDRKRIKAYRQLFLEAKLRFEKLLKDIGLKVLPTKTTFCLVKLPGRLSGSGLRLALLKQGIIIKDCSMYQGLGEEYVYMGIPADQYQEDCVKRIQTVMEELL